MAEVTDPTLLKQLNASGDAFLSTLDPARASMVKAMAEGRQSLPAGYSMRSPYAQELLADTSQYDPTFDAANYPSRLATRKAFTSGKQGQVITSFNTAIGHLGTLAQSAEELDNGSFPLWNRVANWAENETGDPRVGNFDTARNAVVDELTRAFRGTGGNQSDIQAWESTLDSSRSPAQLRGAISKAAQLLGSRIDAMRDSYNQGMGTTDQPLPMLSPHAGSALTSLTGKDYLDKGAAALGGGPLIPPGSGGNGGVDGDIGWGSPQPQQSIQGGQIGFNDRQTAAYDAFMQANPHASADQIKAFASGLGVTIANADAIVSARDQGRGVRSAADAVVEKPAIKTSAGNAFAHGAADAAMLGTTDEVGGFFDAVGDTLTGKGPRSSFLGNMYDHIDDRRAQLQAERDQHPIASVAGGLLGGSIIPIGAGAGSVGALARAGAIGGGLYGFGSGKGNALERLLPAAGGAAAGALGGYAIGRAAPAAGGVLSRFLQPSAERVQANVLAEAAARQGVPMNAGDVRPSARGVLALLEASPGGAPVRSALSEANDAMSGAVDRLGGSGTAGTPASIGDTIQGAGQRAIDWSRDRKNMLYDKAQQLAGDTTVEPSEAIDSLNRHIGELSQTPNANRGVLNLLTDLRGDLTDQDGNARPLSIDAIRNLRSAMRGEIGTRNLTMTDAERRVSDVIDSAGNDITHGLMDAGKQDAADAYRRADSFYRERQTAINDVLQRFMGRKDSPLSGEQAYGRLQSMMGQNGDSDRLGKMMQMLSADERSDVAATVAGQLGRRAPDDDFSPARFVTMAQKITPEARKTVFGQDGASAIDDLLQIASAKRDTGNSLNRSRSGQVLNYDRMLTGALGILGGAGGYAGGGVGGAAAGVLGAGALKMGTMNASARLLTNPGFVSWLSRAPSAVSGPEVAAHIRQLGAVAARQPAIRGEIEQLERLLTQRTIAGGQASAPDDGNQQRQAR